MSNYRKPRRALRTAAVFCFGAVIMGLFSGCYYTKQGRYLLSHQIKANPVSRLLTQSDTPAETREFLLLVEDIRRFSREDLGLNDNKNYTTFLDTGQDVLAYVVSACDPLSFETYQWSYPFLGKMPYKGYYEHRDAKREASRLRGKGFDVWVRGVEGFSTLGFLKDPLYSYMSDYPVHRLANLLIHEQTHATLWRKNDIPFNEDLATFVGETGARLYVAEGYGEESPEYQAIDETDRDYKLFLEDIFALRDELSDYYATLDLPPGKEAASDKAQLLRVEAFAKKQEIIAVFQEDFRTRYPDRYSSDRFLGFADIPVNNAYLDLYQIYEGNREWFEQKYAEAGSDMKVFLDSLR